MDIRTNLHSYDTTAVVQFVDERFGFEPVQGDSDSSSAKRSAIDVNF